MHLEEIFLYKRGPIRPHELGGIIVNQIFILFLYRGEFVRVSSR